MKKVNLQASLINKLLIIILLLIAVILIGGFYYAQNWLKDFAVSSSNSTSQPTANTNVPADQSQIETDLNNQKSAVDKAAKIVVSKQDYQNKIRQDLDKYALDTNVTITDYAPTQQTATNNAPAINGVQSNYVKVSLKNPVPYTNLIKFIQAIETNIPKMKLTGISLTHAQESGDSVTVEPLIIEVYTR
jgi:hypothetical protein